MRLVQGSAQDPGRKSLAAEMPFRFADAILELPDDLVAGDVIVPGHSDTLSFEYEPSLMIQQVRTKAIALRKDGNVVLDSLALGGLRGLTGAMVPLDPDDPQLFGGGPAASTTAIGLNLRHKHMLRHMPEPP